MRVLGIDPGVAIVGFGIVDYVDHRLKPVQYGCVTTEPNSDPALRLQQIFHTVIALIDRYEPQVMAVEKLFFNRNVTTALAVGQARGVLMLAAMERGLTLAEYTPLQVKQAIVGYGKAEKKQVQEMVRLFLRLKETPRPDDAADALAIAICHAHSSSLNSKLNGGFVHD